jgi:hypothetical protein
MSGLELSVWSAWYRFARRILAYSHREAAAYANRRAAEATRGPVAHGQTG